MTKSLKKQRIYKAAEDVFLGIFSWRIWLMLGWQDIRLRYRRSSLGPFWITLSMSITIYSLGILYSHLWKTTLPEYMLYLASGLLAWALISSVVNESASIFLEAKGYLLQIHIPFSVFIMRLLVRNFIIFLHNIVAVVPLLIYYHLLFNWHLLILIPSLILILMPLFVISMLLAMINLRFRDIAQLVTSLMNLAFFATPVMWVASNLPEKYRGVIHWNPFAQFVEIIRAPLMGQLPSEHSVLMMVSIFVIGTIFLVWCLSKYRHRIVFWL
ncbi:MAG: ABC transporter permease [Gammaproteobacteria bacterium]|nr:ABC transporter permease [Gammaproteobacteria bacterium]